MTKQSTTEKIQFAKAEDAQSKRKSSEPFVVPWEDGEAFKLSHNYISELIAKEKKDEYEKEYFYPYNQQFDILTGTLSISTYCSKKRYTISYQINDTHIAIQCGCKNEEAGLCAHVWKSLQTFNRWFGDNYFSRFKIADLHSLTIDQKQLLSVEALRSGLQFKSHKKFGRLYGFINRGEVLYLPYSHLPIRQEQQAMSNKQLVYAIPDDEEHFPEPILLPYMADKNPNKSSKRTLLSFDKSFLLNSRKSFDKSILTPNQSLINSLCQIMLEISDTCIRELSSQIVPSETTPSEDRTLAQYKNQLLFRYWKQMIPFLEKEIVLVFNSTFRNRMIVRPKPSCFSVVRFVTSLPRVIFLLVDDEHSVRLRMTVHIDGRRLNEVCLLSSTSGFFITTGESNDYTLVQSVRDAETIRQFEKLGGSISVLPHQFEKFCGEILDDLTDHYEMSCEYNSSNNVFLKQKQLRLLRRQVILEIQGDHLIVKAQCLYGYSVVVNPLNKGNSVIQASNGKLVLYWRDKEGEMDFHQLLASQHEDFVDEQELDYYKVLVSKVKTGKWLAETVRTLQDHGVEVLGLDDLSGFQVNPHPVKWEMEITGDKDWFDIGLDMRFGKQRISLEALKKGMQYGSEMMELPDGSVGLIPLALKQKLKPLMALAEEGQKGARISSKHFVAIQSFAHKITDNTLRERVKEQRQKLQSLEKIQPLAKPDGVLATLRPYQEAGFSWMGFLREFGWGGILADDMGLGKTLQVLTLLEYHYQEDPHAPASLIVVPNSLLFNWQQEIQKFTPQHKVLVHHGIGRSIDLKPNLKDLVLTTYGTLISDIELLSTIKFSYLILDEAQAIKNSKSKRFASVQSIRSDYRLALSGTPIENGIADLFALMDFVNPGFLGKFPDFKRKFPGIVDGTASKETLEMLQRIISPFMLRRTKVEVAKDLPEKTEMVLYCEMLPKQRAVYERYRLHFRGELESKMDEGMDKATFFVLEGLMKLRQICNSTALIKKEDLGDQSIKLDEIQKHILENTKGHKLLVFSSFTAVLGLLGKRLKQLEFSYAYLDGKSSGEQRQREVAKFQEEESCRVFLISLKAGGTGLNLTAADYVYILDPWWNPAAEAQAIDRCYRIGQDKHVMAYRMICKDSIEEKILQMQANKRALADTLIQEETNVLKSLNKDELLRLFD
ncbi:DEAD/DEAH box helicase [Olivibacter sitiensis]|uniref:DEAD/DEAH box helicase n=1 Tax=Olivibacter sitiensis TaxID=376470 RepID=UPI000688ADBE|nr:DEAD/DEAH box helicase [Olivibacter sitiensis]